MDERPYGIVLAHQKRRNSKERKERKDGDLYAVEGGGEHTGDGRREFKKYKEKKQTSRL
jgi:hypothetical protein